MSHKRYSRRDEPLHSTDLSVCHRVLDHIRNEQEIDASSDESERIASIIIEFYRQGVRDEKQLRALIDTARGFTPRPA
ncbi:hypothetical protein ATY81_20040 [Rhizobium sp. R72]|uniref:hypothetical protein n=1 Tax=unclassified Rhizobium TaxID=2613769 RepID=UPI000B5314B0|nr:MULTISPECIES: hypothetical protein [unclassified Rhizobium]OWV91607.1 hypothetical protein ATY79_28395 [Rhizobium sp. R693]OWW03402.1 hypothetical protein ATY81_20040 [Rhizobium sp. R72]OWW03594.1 hypothetical protein ATY80_20040 [Rhizobium sp. R711]